MKFPIIALIFIGALFFQADAQEQTNPCPLGGTLMELNGIQACGVTAEMQPMVQCYAQAGYHPYAEGTAKGENALACSFLAGAAIANMPNPLVMFNYNFTFTGFQPIELAPNNPMSAGQYADFTGVHATDPDLNPERSHTEAISFTAGVIDPAIACPGVNPAFDLGPAQVGEMNYCYYPAATTDNDTEPDPNCPEGTIGGCEPQDKCVEGGNGMLVCQADPDEKCQVSDSATIGSDGNPLPAYSNCDAGCGFVDQVFMCATEPDGVPNFEKCEITSTGYACPSDNENNDDVTDPNKPISDLKKSDFKEVNQGIEKRQDLNNELLETQLAQDKNIADQTQKSLDGIGGKIDAVAGAVNTMNNNLSGKLDGIGESLDGIGESLDGIGDAFKPGEGNIQGNGNAESWWESEYPDGIKSVWDKHSSAIQQTEFMNFLDSFRLNTTGVQPDMQFCFNLAKLGNYGCKQLVVPDIIWPAIRIFILITAAFAVRIIIFGG